MYVSGNECVSRCPTNKFMHVNGQKECVEDCSYFKSRDSATECFESCWKAGFLQKQGDDGKFECVDACPGPNSFIEGNNTCVSKCDSGIYERVTMLVSSTDFTE